MTIATNRTVATDNSIMARCSSKITVVAAVWTLFIFHCESAHGLLISTRKFESHPMLDSKDNHLFRSSFVMPARRPREKYDDDDDDNIGDDDEYDEGSDDGGGIFARVRRRRGRRGYKDTDEEWDDDVAGAADRLESLGIFDRFNFDDADRDDDDAEEYGGIFEDVLIPNPILDNIDPDGATERFPELARDPKFWFEIFLFITFLDFLSTIGPRNPFPDLPMVLQQATLPPPGI